MAAVIRRIRRRLSAAPLIVGIAVWMRSNMSLLMWRYGTSASSTKGQKPSAVQTAASCPAPIAAWARAT